MSTLPYFPTPASPEQMTEGPDAVQLTAAGPARQGRLTVFFRLLMAIPQGIVLGFLPIAALVVAFIGWWAALFTGRLPEFAQTYLTGFIRWLTRVQAYVMLLTDVYPPFSFDDEPGYPVRIAVPPRERLNRLAVFFRVILVIPQWDTPGVCCDFPVRDTHQLLLLPAHSDVPERALRGWSCRPGRPGQCAGAARR